MAHADRVSLRRVTAWRADWCPNLAGRPLTVCTAVEGCEYQDVVVNDDYHMRMRIPDGMTGWGAAVPDARRVAMRGATAWAEDASGRVGDQSIFNRTVTFNAPVNRSIADGSIQIVGPTEDRDHLSALGELIVGSIAFHP
jgi:hypothetical protein